MSCNFRWRGVAAAAFGLAASATLAVAQDDDDKKTPSMHDLARTNALTHSQADFSAFRYRPAGDKVVEQPDAERLLFRTPDGQPDGYAERRGPAILYYDRSGRVIRVQPISEDATGGR